jgi:phage head maturation protease
VFEVKLPEGNYTAEGLARAVERGEITKCSFAPRTLDDDWSREEDGAILCRLLKIDIYDRDVAAATFPA